MSNEDEYATVLLRPLAGDPVSPSRVDVARAMSDGRRRRRTRWYAGGVAVAAMTATAMAGGPMAVTAFRGPAAAPLPTASASPAVSAAAPAGPRNCRVTRLDTDGVEKAVVTAGDPTGRYAAGRTYPGGADFHYPVVLWKDGRLHAKIEFPGSDQRLDDINAGGVAVGSSYDGDDSYPYVYLDGTMRRLAGGRGNTVAINDAGVIVGSLGGDSRAVRWASPTAQPVELTLPRGADRASAVDIDTDGTILGAVGRGRDRSAGYLWFPDGTGRELPVPTVEGKKGTSFWPTSIRNGWVAGEAVLETKTMTSFAPYRYRIDTGRFEALPVGTGRHPMISANGWVLGMAAKPTITSDAGLTTLPMYPKLTGRVNAQLAGISENGLVVTGHGYSDKVENQPLMWRCR